MEACFARQKEGHAGFTLVPLCFLSCSPRFLCQIVFLLLVVHHLFLFLLFSPRRPGQWVLSEIPHLTFGRVVLMFGGWRFPPCLNPLLCPVSGPLYSVQLDKALNSAVPSAPQFCPLFPVCIYLFSLHSLHNFEGTQKTTEAQSRIARGSESAKKKETLNPELSTALRHSWCFH